MTTPFAESKWWVDATERAPWAGDLERELVDAGLCDWSARTKPHPMEYTMVVEHFLGGVILGLAATWPIYDYIVCFFCKALWGGEDVHSDAHDADCPYANARLLLGMSPWPTAAEVDAHG